MVLSSFTHSIFLACSKFPETGKNKLTRINWATLSEEVETLSNRWRWRHIKPPFKQTLMFKSTMGTGLATQKKSMQKKATQLVLIINILNCLQSPPNLYRLKSTNGPGEVLLQLISSVDQPAKMDKMDCDAVRRLRAISAASWSRTPL